MIGGGDVSPFAGIFSILTIFMVAAAVGLIVGVVIMIVLAVKNRASQNNMIQTMPMKRYCIKCGARIEEGTAFCGKCGASLQSFPPVQEKAENKAEVHTGRENAAAQGQAAANPGPFLRLGFFCCVCCIGNGLVRAFTGVRAVFQKGHARIFNLHSVQKSLTNPNGRRKIKGTSINAVKQDTFYGRLHRRELPGGARQHV